MLEIHAVLKLLMLPGLGSEINVFLSWNQKDGNAWTTFRLDWRTVCLCVCLSDHVSLFPCSYGSVQLSMCMYLSEYLFVYLFVHVSVSLSVRVSMHLYAYVSICLHAF